MHAPVDGPYGPGSWGAFAPAWHTARPDVQPQQQQQQQHEPQLLYAALGNAAQENAQLRVALQQKQAHCDQLAAEVAQLKAAKSAEEQEHAREVKELARRQKVLVTKLQELQELEGKPRPKKPLVELGPDEWWIVRDGKRLVYASRKDFSPAIKRREQEVYAKFAELHSMVVGGDQTHESVAHCFAVIINNLGTKQEAPKDGGYALPVARMLLVRKYRGGTSAAKSACAILEEETLQKIRESWSTEKAAALLAMGNLSFSDLTALKQMDTHGCFSGWADSKIRKKQDEWRTEMARSGFGVERTGQLDVQYGLRVRSIETWLSRFYFLYEKEYGVTLASIPIKQSIDARVHFDVGAKCADYMLEFIAPHSWGMLSVMSIAKWVGSDDAQSLIEQLNDGGGLSITEQLRSLMRNGLCVSGREEAVPITVYEVHDLVALCAAMNCGLSMIGNDFDHFSDEVTKNGANGTLKIGDVYTKIKLESATTAADVATAHNMSVAFLKEKNAHLVWTSPAEKHLLVEGTEVTVIRNFRYGRSTATKITPGSLDSACICTRHAMVRLIVKELQLLCDILRRDKDHETALVNAVLEGLLDMGVTVRWAKDEGDKQYKFKFNEGNGNIADRIIEHMPDVIDKLEDVAGEELKGKIPSMRRCFRLLRRLNVLAQEAVLSPEERVELIRVAREYYARFVDHHGREAVTPYVHIVGAHMDHFANLEHAPGALKGERIERHHRVLKDVNSDNGGGLANARLAEVDRDDLGFFKQFSFQYVRLHARDYLVKHGLFCRHIWDEEAKRLCHRVFQREGWSRKMDRGKPIEEAAQAEAAGEADEAVAVADEGTDFVAGECRGILTSDRAESLSRTLKACGKLVNASNIRILFKNWLAEKHGYRAKAEARRQRESEARREVTNSQTLLQPELCLEANQLPEGVVLYAGTTGCVAFEGCEKWATRLLQVAAKHRIRKGSSKDGSAAKRQKTASTSEDAVPNSTMPALPLMMLGATEAPVLQSEAALARAQRSFQQRRRRLEFIKGRQHCKQRYIRKFKMIRSLHTVVGQSIIKGIKGGGR
mmetsp:Transcript_19314/g.62832  ORF Transcript_19314/g.62832 Transcript_19314/m.62832 type:complete len:1058 (+) Transcript_19314:317-3490(+)